MRLPDGDRLDLVRELNNGTVRSHIPTLVLTASLEHKVAARAMDAGAKGAFTKVVSVPEMAGAIMRLLDSGHLEAKSIGSGLCELLRTLLLPRRW